MDFGVQGQVLAADTMQPVTDAQVGLRLFMDGIEVANIDPFYSYIMIDADGRFEANSIFDMRRSGCQPVGPFASIPEPTRPDQIEIIVVRDGCEQRFLIDMNADTITDLVNQPLGDIKQLKDPILVPGCP